MEEHPILFNFDMVRAILDGRKTQTRRVIKPQPDTRTVDIEIRKGLLVAVPYSVFGCWIASKPIKCPYGGPGDSLWVRETFAYLTDYTGNDPGVYALAKGCFYRADYPIGDFIEDEIKRWRPSIHIPRLRSRITLGIIDIRAERLQDISVNDINSEGIACSDCWTSGTPYPKHDFLRPIHCGCRSLFVNLWDSINAKRGYGWDTNPWVWVIEFKKL